MFTIPLFSDWEMDFNREAYEVALTATLERFESGLGTELTLSPASEFRIGLGGRISRKSISARTDIDFPMIAYVQNLIRSTRRAKYDSGKHVIERRCLDRLPLKDGSTKWYGEKSKSLEFWSKFDKGTGTVLMQDSSMWAMTRF
jgi:hypothetical protein